MIDTATNILLLLVIALLAAAATAFIIFMITMIWNMLSKVTIPKRKIPKKKQEIRRTERVSEQQKEAITFNDIFMFMIAVPLVLLWVGFAGYVIWHGLRDPSVLAQIEGYTTLIAILGGPALLIIKDALDVWKQEQAEKTAFYKIKAQAVIDYNEAAQRQAQQIESNQQAHEHILENPVKGKKK